MPFATLTIACETFRKQLSFLEKNVPKRARFNEAWSRFPFADTLGSISFLTDVEQQTVTLYVTDYTNTVAVTYPANTNAYLMVSVNARDLLQCVESLTGQQVRFRVEPRSLILSDDAGACVSIKTLAEDHTATIDYATLRQEPTIAFEAAKLIPVLKGLVPFAHQAEGHETNSIFFDAGRLSAQDGSCYAYQTFETQGVRGLVPLHTIKQLIALASKSKGSVGVWHSDDRLIFVVEDVRLIALLRPRRLAFELSDLIVPSRQFQFELNGGNALSSELKSWLANGARLEATAQGIALKEICPFPKTYLWAAEHISIPAEKNVTDLPPMGLSVQNLLRIGKILPECKFIWGGSKGLSLFEPLPSASGPTVLVAPYALS